MSSQFSVQVEDEVNGSKGREGSSGGKGSEGAIESDQANLTLPIPPAPFALNLTSTAIPVRANRPLVLDQPDTLLILTTGELAVFATYILNGQPEGERRYLFNVSCGQALFGYRAKEMAHHLGLIAVPLEPSEVSGIDLNGLAVHEKLELLKTYIDPWIRSLGDIDGWPTPQAGDDIAAHYLSLLPGQRCQPPVGTVQWISVRRGELQWRNQPEFVLTAETGCFPVSATMPLTANGDVELFARGTEAVQRVEVLVKGLAQLHQYVLDSVQQWQMQYSARVQQQFTELEALNQQSIQQTLQQLGSILLAPTAVERSAESAVLAAAGRVGRALGVPIRPPRQAEDLQPIKEPLDAIARASQLRLRRVLLRGNWWQRDHGPLVAYTRMEHHPVALIPVTGDRYELVQPGTAEMSPSSQIVDAALAHTLDPAAYMFYPPLPDGDLTAWKLLRFVLRGRYGDMVALLLAGIVATLIGMVVPQATAVLIDQAIPFGNSNLLWGLGLGLLAAAFGSAAFRLTQAIASMRIETASDVTLQAAVWDRLLSLRTTFFRDYSTGDLNARVSSITAIRQILSGTLLQSFLTGMFALLNLGLLIYYSPLLASLAFGVAIATLLVTTITGILIVNRQRPLKQMEGELYGTVVQLISGMSKLRTAGAENRAFAQWGKSYVQQLRIRLNTQQLEDTVEVFNTTAPTVATILIFALASLSVSGPQSMARADLSTGTFLAFFAAYGIFIRGATSLSAAITEAVAIYPLWLRSQPILQAQPEVSADAVDPGILSGRIKVDHASFRYRSDGPLILDNVTLDIEPGEFVALVGPSGSGKSTIFRLLMGFEIPQSGEIYYDGQALAGLDIAAVRRQFGTVLQNGRINAGSIFENIAGGALISMEAAWQAAEMSGLAADIQAMPMQMHTVINEGGSNLSGGQRQRLVIARALAHQPRILLLDEATSALDNHTQAIVSRSMSQLQVTRLVVAHRLSTIRDADRIYVLDTGRIVQQGTFDELAQQPGLFQRLIQRQIA